MPATRAEPELAFRVITKEPVNPPEKTPAPEETPATEAPAEAAPAEPETPPAQPVANWVEAHVELHRRGFSCGSIDGLRGGQTAEAMKAFQTSVGIPATGAPDRATLQKLGFGG